MVVGMNDFDKGIERTLADIGKISGSAKEAKLRFSEDLERRTSNPNGILNPSDLQKNYDFSRLLNTTLGGVKRAITSDDLAQFRNNAQKLGKKYTGGITSRQVIDQSLKIDRDRARQQITMAIPTYAQHGGKSGGLVVRFITNASKKYGETRHHVVVEFSGYNSAVVSGADKSVLIAAKRMTKQPIRFDCDCGRHTFWYRYIATIGNYNFGRAETGYPKVRNPNLIGVACKHVLRVMAEIEGSGSVASFLARAIDKGRDAADVVERKSVRIQVDKKEAQKVLERQEKRNTNRIDDQSERDLYRARIALRKQVSKATVKPKFYAGGSKKSKIFVGNSGGKSADEALSALMLQFGLSASQVKKMLSGR